jgi:hypothetical protein
MGFMINSVFHPSIPALSAIPTVNSVLHPSIPALSAITSVPDIIEGRERERKNVFARKVYGKGKGVSKEKKEIEPKVAINKSAGISIKQMYCLRAGDSSPKDGGDGEHYKVSLVESGRGFRKFSVQSFDELMEKASSCFKKDDEILFIYTKGWTQTDYSTMNPPSDAMLLALGKGMIIVSNESLMDDSVEDNNDSSESQSTDDSGVSRPIKSKKLQPDDAIDSNSTINSNSTTQALEDAKLKQDTPDV